MISQKICCDICSATSPMEVNGGAPPPGWSEFIVNGTLQVDEAERLADRDKKRFEEQTERQIKDMAADLGVPENAISGVATLFGPGTVLPAEGAPRVYSFQLHVCPDCYGSHTMLEVMRSARVESANGNHNDFHWQARPFPG